MIDKELLKSKLPFIEALANGKNIQFKCKDGKWVDVTDLSTLTSLSPYNEPYEHRITPYPQLRPWKPEEVPIGAIFRFKRHNGLAQVILGVTQQGIKFFSTSTDRMETYSFDAALDLREHSTDNGKTWHPCGVEE